MQNLVTCRGLCKSYGNTEALSNVDITLQSGRIIGLLGPNGSGKTTLIKLLAGLLTPTSGVASVLGHCVGESTKAMVSYLPERTYFDRAMKVEECIELFSDFYDDFDEQRARSLMARLAVPTDAQFRTLSKGTCEKVQLILVMSRRAKLYLLDEPIGGVDPAARDFILETILSNQNYDSTILISTHLIHDIESVLDEAVFLQSGHVVMHDTADNLRSKYGKSIDDVFREVFRC
ncbi:MAG: ABC transporter ATP-binding protein [Clostridia bacterium]|nr:ABC transporter ATP-binding protein [Clostridia bacterium]